MTRSWERTFAERFVEIDSGWQIEREVAILNLKDTVFIPDFAFRHADGRTALLEIVGFWRPEYLRRKIMKLKRSGRTDMIVAVSADLNVGEDDFKDVSGSVFFFQKADQSQGRTDAVRAGWAGCDTRILRKDARSAGHQSPGVRVQLPLLAAHCSDFSPQIKYPALTSIWSHAPPLNRDPNRQQDGAAALAQERRIASNQTPVAPADNNKWHSEPGKSNDV